MCNYICDKIITVVTLSIWLEHLNFYDKIITVFTLSIGAP